MYAVKSDLITTEVNTDNKIDPNNKFYLSRTRGLQFGLGGEVSDIFVSLFGRVECFYCWSHDVNIKRGGCTQLTCLGVVSSRQGCFCNSHISGVH